MRFHNPFDNFPPTIQSTIRHIVAVATPRKLILFGSRARGEARDNSDFDLCVQNKKCTDAAWTELLVDLSEEPFTLYKIDLVEYEKLGDDYRRQIESEGLLIYG